MAITKQRKNELVNQYGEWTKRSQAMIVVQYLGMTMKDVDTLRAKAREVGGEFHIVKNTLARVAFEQADIPAQGDLLEGSTAIGFAFQDGPALAKVFADFAKTSEVLKIKGGYLGKQTISAAGVKALADLPPLPVMRATLLGVLMAPASKLVRTLAEPGRQIAAVLQAHIEPEATAA